MCSWEHFGHQTFTKCQVIYEQSQTFRWKVFNEKSPAAYSEHTHTRNPFRVTINIEEGRFKHS